MCKWPPSCYQITRLNHPPPPPPPHTHTHTPHPTPNTYTHTTPHHTHTDSHPNPQPPGRNGRKLARRHSNFTKVFTWGPINNMPVLVQVVAWHRTGDKPLFEPTLTQFSDAIRRHWGRWDKYKGLKTILLRTKYYVNFTWIGRSIILSYIRLAEKHTQCILVKCQCGVGIHLFHAPIRFMATWYSVVPV